MSSKGIISLAARQQGQWAVYIGNADEIVATGIATMDMLPGKANNPRGLMVYEPDGQRRVSKMGPVVAGMLRIIVKKSMGCMLYEVWQRLGVAAAPAPAAAWPFPVVVGGLPS